MLRLMTRRSVLRSGAASAAAAQADTRPNVLFLMLDQFRVDALGANSKLPFRTPNLDRLANSGANFSHMFVQSPVCVPSRVSHFTGRYPHSHKNRVNYTPCDPREVFLQRRLRDAGYTTGSVGKLHYYPATAEHARSTGWDEVRLDDGVGHTDRFSDYVKWRNANDPRRDVPYLGTAPGGKNPFRGAIDYEFTPTAWTGRETRTMLRRFASSARPFFLYSSFFKPHAPHTVPVPYDSMFDGVEVPRPESTTREQVERLPLPLQKLILRGKPRPAVDRERLQWIWRSYAAGVAMVDREIGLILDELRGAGKWDNTIVVLSSDHGDQLMEHGFEGKNAFFESSVRIPFFLHWPARIAAARYDHLVETLDLVPTLLDLCRLPTPANVQGRSLAPLLLGRAYRPRDAVFSENVIPEVITSGSLDMAYEQGKGIAGIRHPDAKMTRTKDWKLNYYPGYEGELYDLRNDPGETRNVRRDRPEVVREMKDRTLDWMITADEPDQIAPRWLL